MISIQTHAPAAGRHRLVAAPRRPQYPWRHLVPPHRNSYDDAAPADVDWCFLGYASVADHLCAHVNQLRIACSFTYLPRDVSATNKQRNLFNAFISHHRIVLLANIARFNLPITTSNVASQCSDVLSLVCYANQRFSWFWNVVWIWHTVYWPVMLKRRLDTEYWPAAVLINISSAETRITTSRSRRVVRWSTARTCHNWCHTLILSLCSGDIHFMLITC